MRYEELNSFELRHAQAILSLVIFQSILGAEWAYGTVQHILPPAPSLLYVTFHSAGIEWLEQLETTKQLVRHGHDCAPVIEFSAVL